ncbi:efflux RND transporter periplasmic adaptor subunit [Butyricimonas synergistica]|uniref:efflux RND transporter periplasmic adaptor subunit n=1 Tax=Butyricimonas synergistica TaxID=544644 RepID=UPI0003A30F0D|nr:efflux RND transporter periplasmic adaptor subunit [Butyricimonas synergistica]
MRFTWMVCMIPAFLWVGCKGKKETYQDVVRPVRVVNVEALGAINKVYTGIVEAEEYSNLAFKLSGPLVAMNVDEGQKVKKGQVIAAVDPLDYKLQYEANKAAYLTAKSQLERNKRLLSMQAISKQEYEIAEANYIKGKSAYETSANTLEDTKLRAPFDGFVEKKFVENYQKVMPGESIIKLVNPDKLAVGFTLPETSVDLTRTPMTVTVEFDTYKGIWFKARVKEFIDASPDGTGIPVKLVIDDSRFSRDVHNIYPGFSCKVNLKIETTEENSYIVPMSALFKNPTTNETSVWVYNPKTETVHGKAVEIGQLFGSDKIMVQKGLTNDDIIVVAGVNYITEGQKVKLLK